ARASSTMRSNSCCFTCGGWATLARRCGPERPVPLTGHCATHLLLLGSLEAFEDPVEFGESLERVGVTQAESHLLHDPEASKAGDTQRPSHDVDALRARKAGPRLADRGHALLDRGGGGQDEHARAFLLVGPKVEEEPLRNRREAKDEVVALADRGAQRVLIDKIGIVHA